MNIRNAAVALTAVAVLAVAVWSAEAPAAKSDSRLVSGYRGITLPMSGADIAFLKKGDRVDVLVTFDAVMTDKAKDKMTATILQNVLVINVQKPAKLEEKGAVEILVNPNEAQYAALGQKQGDLAITIRAEDDKVMAPMEMASFRKLFR